MRLSFLRCGGLAAIFGYFVAVAPTVDASLVIIGDSLSDTGNAFALTDGTTPPSLPYFDGRFSNGPVWVEELADALGLPAPLPHFDPTVTAGTNFAVGGATTLSTDPSVSFGMNLQLQALQVFMHSNPSFGDLADDLVILWGGANDFFSAVNAGVAADPADSVANLVAIITDLLNLGAESLLLANLPPLDQTPEFNGSPAEGAAAAFSITFDGLYRAAVADLRSAHSAVDFLYFDVYTAMQDVIDDPLAFGFTNVDDSLLYSGPVSNPEGYLFWDGVHPTAAGHAELARIAVGLVPAPSVLLLVLPGVVALGTGTAGGVGRDGAGGRRWRTVGS